ncbi:hypothetical protein [Romboutsia sp. 13368]|uniref:hypothetical protein n=1 Tax=Romboutsia sp. 13368 TaxID=2708053 RepID=UPI0025FB1F17|nr:hypothetical protein [Romboutsia sp. 13368]
MNFSNFRKLDYILFYLVIAVLFIVQLYEFSLISVIGILLGATIPALILGTITNFIFKKK